MTSSGKGVLLSVMVHAAILVCAVLLSRFIHTQALALQENAPIEIEVFEESVASEPPSEEKAEDDVRPSEPAENDSRHTTDEVAEPVESTTLPLPEPVDESIAEASEPISREHENTVREPVDEPEAQRLQKTAPQISIAVEADSGADRQTVTAVTVLEEKKAVPVSVIRPKYPPSARRKGIEGDVLLEATVDVSGNVSAVIIRRSSGNKALDDAAVDAMKKAKFRSAEKNGEKVPSTIIQTLSFRLR